MKIAQAIGRSRTDDGDHGEPPRELEHEDTDTNHLYKTAQKYVQVESERLRHGRRVRRQARRYVARLCDVKEANLPTMRATK